MSVIQNVVFNYVKIKKPVPKYGMADDCSIGDREFSVDVCLPTKAVKGLKKKYKAVKAVKNMATYDAEAYLKTFKVDAPDAETYADEEGDYSVLKLTAFAGYTDGEAVPDAKVPRVVGTKSPTVASDGKEVGRSIEVGNGSTGRVSFVERPWEYKGAKGLSLDLTGIQVASLVSYVSSASNENEFEFEDEDDFQYDKSSDSDATDDDTTAGGDTPTNDEAW
jgi:hypothetical protein